MKNKKILDTELVTVIDTGTEYQVLIKMSQGGMLEHEPMPRDLRGLVGALTLATEVCAGKFFPRRVLDINGDIPKVEKLKIGFRGDD